MSLDNHVVMKGYVCNDPILSDGKNDSKYTCINLSVKLPYKKNPNDDYNDSFFMNCFANNQQAINITKFVKKGFYIEVSGFLKPTYYYDEKRNVEVNGFALVVKEFQVLRDNRYKNKDINNESDDNPF